MTALDVLPFLHGCTGIYEIDGLTGFSRFTEEELAYYRRGKNSHVHAVPKSATPAEYAKATGVETLFGALFLLGRKDRANEIFNTVMEAEHGL